MTAQNLPVTIQQAPVPTISFEQQVILAEAVAKSGLFGLRTADQAMVLMAICEAEGLHPAIAARDYHIVQGRPALKADAMLARFMAAGGRVEWHQLDDTTAEATFSHPAGGSVRLAWTIEQARRAGLGTDTWKKYPRAMLRARLVSEGIRTVYPGVLVGMYTPEEIMDLPAATVEPAAPGQTEPSTTAPTSRTEQVKAALGKKAPAAPVPEQQQADPPAPGPDLRTLLAEVEALGSKAAVNDWKRAHKPEYDRLSPKDQKTLSQACSYRIQEISIEAKRAEQQQVVAEQQVPPVTADGAAVLFCPVRGFEVFASYCFEDCEAVGDCDTYKTAMRAA